MWSLRPLSRIAHNVSYRDTYESFCSRAWRLQDESYFWVAWTYVFGRRHCAASFKYYWVTLDQFHQKDQRRTR